MNSKQEEVALMDAALLQAVDSLAQGLAHAAAKNRQCCLHCAFFDERQGEVCTRAKPPARPPARIIAFGCPGFEGDIPF